MASTFKNITYFSKNYLILSMNWYFSGYVITTHKQSLGQSNAFTPVFHSVHGGSLSRRGLCSGGSMSRGEGSLSRGKRISLRGGGVCQGDLPVQ